MLIPGLAARKSTYMGRGLGSKPCVPVKSRRIARTLIPALSGTAPKLLSRYTLILLSTSAPTAAGTELSRRAAHSGVVADAGVAFYSILPPPTPIHDYSPSHLANTTIMPFHAWQRAESERGMHSGNSGQSGPCSTAAGDRRRRVCAR
ncbi:hypothetical protein MVEN_00058200 [Mycena venus]|uniref:Uncharacterized protein n=1 Tax=Mycena venus TaxID=2733690 RepID=A0A8H6Z7Y7_9AGAR|nr:hypothetical protein MVEN_00058200 [Mycena venus]